MKIKNYDIARRILNDASYHEFFKQVTLKNSKLVLDNLGIDVSSDVYIPYLDFENKRLEKITLMIATINILNSIYDEIKVLNKEKKKDNKKINELEGKYKDLVIKSLIRLKERDLIDNINDFASKEDFNSSFKVIDIDKKTKNYFLKKSNYFHNWPEYFNYLEDKQIRLLNKLYDYSYKNGYFEFNIKKEEMDMLLDIETTIIAIMDNAYYEKKKLNSYNIDKDKLNILTFILGENTNISRESLAIYIENTKLEIKKLLNNPLLCDYLNISKNILNLNQTIDFLIDKFDSDNIESLSI